VPAPLEHPVAVQLRWRREIARYTQCYSVIPIYSILDTSTFANAMFITLSEIRIGIRVDASQNCISRQHDRDTQIIALGGADQQWWRSHAFLRTLVTAVKTHSVEQNSGGASQAKKLKLMLAERCGFSTLKAEQAIAGLLSSEAPERIDGVSLRLGQCPGITH
jgi:hypothetical protein